MCATLKQTLEDGYLNDNDAGCRVDFAVDSIEQLHLAAYGPNVLLFAFHHGLFLSLSGGVETPSVSRTLGSCRGEEPWGITADLVLRISTTLMIKSPTRAATSPELRVPQERDHQRS
jgi:hypothetical protein